MKTMRHTFRPAIPYSSIAILSLFGLGLVLATDDSLPISASGGYFFLILAPLALYHLHRVAASLQFFELSSEGIAAHGLFRRRGLRFAEIEGTRFSRLTGDFVVHAGSVRIAIPAACARFGDLHLSIVTGIWAHQDQQIPEAAPVYILRPSFAERAHAAYAVSAPMFWAGCITGAVGLGSPGVLGLLLTGGALQAAINFHGLRQMLNWYEIRADGLLIHSLWRQQFLPAGEFLTSMVREDSQGRSLELAFFKETIHLRFTLPLPAEELAGMLNHRWTAQASY